MQHLGRGVDPAHGRHPSKLRQKTHASPRAAAQVNAVHFGPDPGALREVHRGLKTPDMYLLAHDQLPEVPLRAAINGLDVFQADILHSFHCAVCS